MTKIQDLQRQCNRYHYDMPPYLDRRKAGSWEESLLRLESIYGKLKKTCEGGWKPVAKSLNFMGRENPQMTKIEPSRTSVFVSDINVNETPKILCLLSDPGKTTLCTGHYSVDGCNFYILENRTLVRGSDCLFAYFPEEVVAVKRSYGGKEYRADLIKKEGYKKFVFYLDEHPDRVRMAHEVKSEEVGVAYTWFHLPAKMKWVFKGVSLEDLQQFSLLIQESDYANG